MKLDSFASVESTDSVEEDRLPSARSKALDSGIYPVTVDLAYIDKSSTGAVALKLIYKEHPFEGFTLREDMWIRSGDKKGNKSYYVDSEGNKKDLPGLLQANTLAYLTTGKPLSELEAEEKTVKMWSFEAKKEVPTKVTVVADLIGKKLHVGVMKKVQNKRVKGGDGEWGPGPDKQEVNEITKLFDEEMRTAAEKRANEDPAFHKRWEEKYAGAVIDEFDDSIKGDSSPKINTAAETEPLFAD